MSNELEEVLANKHLEFIEKNSPTSKAQFQFETETSYTETNIMLDLLEKEKEVVIFSDAIFWLDKENKYAIELKERNIQKYKNMLLSLSFFERRNFLCLIMTFPLSKSELRDKDGGYGPLTHTIRELKERNIITDISDSINYSNEIKDIKLFEIIIARWYSNAKRLIEYAVSGNKIKDGAKFSGDKSKKEKYENSIRAISDSEFISDYEKNTDVFSLECDEIYINMRGDKRQKRENDSRLSSSPEKDSIEEIFKEEVIAEDKSENRSKYSKKSSKVKRTRAAFFKTIEIMSLYNPKNQLWDKKKIGEDKCKLNIQKFNSFEYLNINTDDLVFLIRKMGLNMELHIEDKGNSYDFICGIEGNGRFTVRERGELLKILYGKGLLVSLKSGHKLNNGNEILSKMKLYMDHQKILVDKKGTFVTEIENEDDIINCVSKMMVFIKSIRESMHESL